MPLPRGAIYTYFTKDHRRLDRLLKRTVSDDGSFDLAPFRKFRAGILRHIWQEERLLLPAVQPGQNGGPYADAARLRLDHGAISALLVPPPSRESVAVLRHILTRHNSLEEDPGGLYERCEAAVGELAEELMARVYMAPEIPTMPFNEDPDILPAIKRAIARAGYDFDEIAGQT